MKVGVIGAGTMGQGIAKAFAQVEGYEVALCDIKQEWADGGKEKIAKGYARLVEKGKMKKFLENHPTYTEESIKELLKSFATEIVNKNLTHSAEQKVIDKLANDNKISKYADMDIVRCNIHGYNEKAGLFMAKVTLTNGRDQYMMFLQFNLVGDELTLVKYQVQRGDVVGF